MPKEQLIDSNHQFLINYNALKSQGLTESEIAESLGFKSRHSLYRYLLKVRKSIKEGSSREFCVEFPLSPDIDPKDLWEERKRKYSLKNGYEKSRKAININIKIDGPIGILFFGDPHLDDDGTDLEHLERDAKLVQSTEGLFGVNGGDNTNNWVGRLARLYGDQSTSAKEAIILAEHFIKMVDWLYMIGGNHDDWSGPGDPIRWIMRQTGTLYESREVRAILNFPNGSQVSINSKHDFPGNSQWNPAHGVMKEAQIGLRDDIIISFHKHSSGYGLIKNPINGNLCHAIQVASYKKYDRYARERAFKDQHISPSVLCVIDPYSKDPTSRIIVFKNAEAGAKYLTLIRNEFKRNSPL